MKKLIALLLALVMVFSLAACGAGSSEQKAPETQPVVGEKEDSAQEELENKENNEERRHKQVAVLIIADGFALGSQSRRISGNLLHSSTPFA